MSHPARERLDSVSPLTNHTGVSIPALNSILVTNAGGESSICRGQSDRYWSVLNCFECEGPCLLNDEFKFYSYSAINLVNITMKFENKTCSFPPNLCDRAPEEWRFPQEKFEQVL